MVSLATAACSHEPVASLKTGEVSQAILSGSGQEAMAGMELPNPVQVRVLDEVGRPLAGQVVRFEVTAGGGEVFAGAAVTDSRGYAREWWTLGLKPGVNRLEVRILDAALQPGRILGTFEARGI